MIRTLVAALTACLVCLALVGCDSKSSSGGSTATGAKREVSSEARAAPGAGANTIVTREQAEDPADSTDD